MRIYIYYAVLIVFIFIGCNNSTENIPIPNEKIKNENLLVKTLIYTNWLSISEIFSCSHGDLRNAIAANLKSKTSQSLETLQDLGDNELSWAAIMVKFLTDADIINIEEVKLKTIDECLKMLILENVKNTSFSSNHYESKSISENLSFAHEWWFKKNVTSKTIIDKFNNVVGSNPIHKLKDNRNIGMDVLRITKSEEDFLYLGVSHYLVNNNQFNLSLSGSNDLKNWTFITDLGSRAHQGDIEKWGNAYIIANEQDEIAGSNNIQIRFFSSYEDLKENNPSYNKSIQRTLAPSAEGTPDIRRIEGESASDLYILIGFHYYEDRVRDQLAFGILKSFNEWKSWKDIVSNSNIQKMGYRGNIGGREYFGYSNSNYVLQEAQLSQGDWGAWRLLLGNGMFYHTLKPITALRSISFANPGVFSIDNKKFAITSFMHSDVNKTAEAGELIYFTD